MTVVRVTSLRGALDDAARMELGDSLTRAVLEVETGKDTPQARAGVMVQFEELAPGHWYHGGVAVEERYPANGVFGVAASVMQGPWTPELKSELIDGLARAIRDTVGTAERQAMWFTISEVPNGAWGVNGSVVGIEKFLWAFDPERQATIRKFLDLGEPGS